MRLFVLLALASITGLCATVVAAQTLAFDWGVRNAQVAGSDVIPVPHQGHDYPANHSIYNNLYNTLDAQGLPIALMLQNDQGGNSTATTVANHLSSVNLPLDYVMADFESANRYSHVDTLVNQIRGHADPDIKDAFIGNYAMYANPYDYSAHFKHIADRTAANPFLPTEDHQFYLDSGLNISQPNAYPYEYHASHAVNTGGITGWGTFLSPNARSALFYAPLERVSGAKRFLPEGHLLVPWLAGAVEWAGYTAPDPTVEDHKALAQHIRMRGADGYYTLVSWIGSDGSVTPPPGYPSHAQYRENVSDAWSELDWLFAGAEEPEILNLDTVKLSGLEWSGMRQGDEVAFLVTNLGNTSGQVDFPDLPGLPDMSPVVPVGTHELFTYTLTAAGVAGDYDENGVVDAADYSVWLDSLGDPAGLPNDNSLGAVGQSHYDLWKANFGTSSGTGSANSDAIPEPASLALLLMGAWGFMLSSRRSRLLSL